MSTYASVVLGLKGKEKVQQDGRNIKTIGRGTKVMIISPEGVAYYIDVLSGVIDWLYKTGGAMYESVKPHGAESYIDLHESMDMIHLYRFEGLKARSKLKIPRDTNGMEKQEMSKQLEVVFHKTSVERFEKMFHVDSLRGAQCDRSNANALEIKRIDWYITGTIVGTGTSMLHFAEVSVSDCNVYCAYSPKRFIELCGAFGVRYIPGEGELVKVINLGRRIQIKYPIEERAKRNGDIMYMDGTLNFHGTSGKKDVFIKKVPVEVDCSSVIEIYESCAHIANIVNLILVERDERFYYMAFEQTRGTFFECMEESLVSSELFKRRAMTVIRHVVFALMQLHKNDIIHGSVAPHHILIRKGPGNLHKIKLCGLGKSVRIPKGNRNITQAYINEKYQLARTILAFLLPKTHKYEDPHVDRESETSAGWKTPTRKAEFKEDLTAVGHEIADLCKKLMDSSLSSFIFLTAYNHISFWDAKTKIDFICALSSALNLMNQRMEVEYLSERVFTGNWKKIIGKDSWVKKMEAASMHRTNSENARDAYKPESLHDLIKFFRNSWIHSEEIEVQSPSLLVTFITTKFPKFTTVMYNHVAASSWMHHTLFERFFLKESDLM